MLASIILGSVILIEGYFNSGPLRIFNYSKEQYIWALIPSLINYVAYGSQTIAMQNDSPAFVTLLAYIGLVYSFFGDVVIFNEELRPLELVGVALILSMNVWMVYDKLK